MDLAFVFYCPGRPRSPSLLRSCSVSFNLSPSQPLHNPCNTCDCVLLCALNSAACVALRCATIQYRIACTCCVRVCVRARLCFLHLSSIEFIAFIVASASWRYFNIFVVVIAVTVVTVCYFLCVYSFRARSFLPGYALSPRYSSFPHRHQAFCCVYCFSSAMFCSTRLIHWIIWT